jgi:uncharacterized protein (TIGR03083 family)
MTIEWNTRGVDTPELLESLRRDSAALLAGAHAADPTAAIAGCPGWTPVDLVWHIGEVHWFWSTIVADRLAGPDEYVEPDRPDADDDVFAFAEQAAVRLDDTLSTTDPSTEVWTWSEPHNAGFVIRRMAHETAVHRLDAERAAGRDHRIDTELAADGVDEFLTHFLRWAAKDAEPVGGSVHLHCGDTAGEWTVTTDDDSGWNVAREHSKGDAALRGDAHELLMVLWRRVPLDTVQVFGDRDVAERFVAHTNLSG